MTDIGQRYRLEEPLGPRAAEADLVRERSRQISRKNRTVVPRGHEHLAHSRPLANRSVNSPQYRKQALAKNTLYCGEQLQTYGMEVIGQPLAEARPGIAFSLPVVVRIGTARIGGDHHEDITELSNLLAVATLVRRNDNGTTASVGPGVLAGQRLFDSVHATSEELGFSHASNSSDGRTIGYVSFPDLVIQQEGCYSVRVTLIRVGSIFSDCANPLQGGSNIQVIDSAPVKVCRRANRA